MAKSNAQLTAEIEKLTMAHEVMVKDAAKQKAKDAEEIEALKKANEDLKAKAEAAKAAANQQRLAKAEEQKKGMRAKLDAEEKQWVQVFYKGLKDGVDFGFTYENVPFRLFSGAPVLLPVSVIKHLKGRFYPIILLKQGEAGQPVKVKGKHYNFTVQTCEPPEEAPQKAVG